METKEQKKLKKQLELCGQFIGCTTHKQLALRAFEYEEMLYEQGWRWDKRQLEKVKTILKKIYSLMRNCDYADLEGRYASLYPQPLKSYFPLCRGLPVKLPETPWVEEIIFDKKVQNHLEQYCGV